MVEIMGTTLTYKYIIYAVSNDYDEYIKLFENEQDAIYWCEEHSEGNPVVYKRYVY